MKRTISIIGALVAVAAAAFLLLPRRGESQPADGVKELTVAIYAPTVPFAGSQAQADYVNALAKAIKDATGVDKVTGKVAASYGAAKQADFAIIEAQCVATGSGTVLANAVVGGGTSRGWALFTSSGGNLTSLRGKRLAYVKTGCSDNAFADNAMLESEVGDGFFSARVGAGDVATAVAQVSRRAADAVFAPVGQQKGLTKVLDAPAVPNPAFVQNNGKLPAGLVAKVSRAVTGYGGTGAISDWKAADPGDYKSLRARMGTRVKQGVAAAPDVVRTDSRDVLKQPDTLDQVELPPVDQHVEAPPGRLE